MTVISINTVYRKWLSKRLIELVRECEAGRISQRDLEATFIKVLRNLYDDVEFEAVCVEIKGRAA
jgi:hypothetical protein